jgi:hypothetical protein
VEVLTCLPLKSGSLAQALLGYLHKLPYTGHVQGKYADFEFSYLSYRSFRRPIKRNMTCNEGSRPLKVEVHSQLRRYVSFLVLYYSLQIVGFDDACNKTLSDPTVLTHVQYRLLWIR